LVARVSEWAIYRWQSVEYLADDEHADGQRHRDLNHHIELINHLPRLDFARFVGVGIKVTGGTPEAIRSFYFICGTLERACVRN
jgi:hypothetical protein